MKTSKASLLDRTADFVTARPLLVTLAFVALTGGLATQLPPRPDPAPEKLLATEPDPQALDLAPYRSMFQDTEKVLVVLVEGRDVLTREPLQYLHDLARHFEGQRFVSRVLSLTTMPLPRRKEEEEVSLDDLDAIMNDEQAEREAAPPRDPAVLDALNALVDANPSRYPDGFGGLVSRLDGQLTVDPIVEGDEVTDEDAQELRATLEQSPLLQGRMVARDGSVIVAVLQLRADADDPEAVGNAVRATRGYIAAHAPPSGITVRLGGLPYIRASIVEYMRRDQVVLVPATLLVCMLLLYLSFRWWPGVIMPLVAAGVLVLIQIGGMALAGEPMNVINNVIPTYLIIVSITNSIHYIQRYRDAHRKTHDALESRKIAIRSMGLAILMTAAVDAAGFGALGVSEAIMLRRFGVIASIGVMIGYVVTITLLPATLSWWSPPPTGSGKTHTKPGWLEKTIVGTTRWVLRHSWRILAAMLVLLVLLGWAASGVSIDHALLDQFDPASDVYQTTRVMEDKLDGVRPLDVIIAGEGEKQFLDPATMDTLDAVAEWARRRPEILSAMSHSDVMHESLALLADDPSIRGARLANARETDALRALLTHRSRNPLQPYLSEDGRAVRLQLKVKDVGSKQTLVLIKDLEREIRRRFPSSAGFHFGMTGDAYVSSLGLRAVIGDLGGSLVAAIGIIFLLLLVRFRSWRLSILSIPPYLIPLVGTLAYMRWRGIPLNATTLIIFSVSIGMAVNGSIHLLQRCTEEQADGRLHNVALLRAARGAGRGVFVAGVTLMLGFGVMFLSRFMAIRHFGELLAITLSTCTLSTMIVQPALLQVAGRSKREILAERQSH